MAVFIRKTGYYPKIGDKVRGKYSKRKIVGIVLPHPKKQTEPYIFSTRWGCVLCYIETEDGKKLAVNELEPVK